MHDELDRLEERAFEAWCADDPALDGEVFVDRVMAAESAQLPLLLVPSSTTLEPQSSRPRRALRWGLSMAAAAGVGAMVATWFGSREPAAIPMAGDLDSTASPAVAQDFPTPVLELARAGKPQLRLDGNPGMPLPADLDVQIKDYIAGYGRHWGPAFQFHGVVAVARAGELEYARGFGVARPQTGTPNGPGTRFRIGMLTEQFTAALVLDLRDAGELSLDDPLTRYIPEMASAQGVTIAHLLAHRSGLPSYTSAPGFGEWKAEAQNAEQMLARWSTLAPAFEPGSAFESSNTGYYLLGVIIERVTGRSYAEMLKTELFGPLEMRASGFGDVYETGEQAVGNVWRAEEELQSPAPVHLSAFGAAGGVVSSALDLVKWDHALAGDEILAASSIDEMLTDHGDGHGYGFAMTEGYGQRVASFAASTEGFEGFTGAMIRFLEDQTLVVVLSNNDVIPGMKVAQDVAAMVYGDEPAPRREYHEVEIAPGTFPRYLGAYVLTEQTHQAYADEVDPALLTFLERVQVGRHGERLYLEIPGRGRTWMHPRGHHRFFFKDHSGSTVSFDVGPRKEAVRMNIHYPQGDVVLEREAESPPESPLVVE